MTAGKALKTAYPRDPSSECIVRLVTGPRCPFCDRVLAATDVEIVGRDIELICHGDDCHQTVLTIERFS